MENHNEIGRLNQKIARLRTLIEVNEMISSSLEIDTILENVMTISKKVMNADASSLMRVDEKTNELIYQVAQGSVGERQEHPFHARSVHGCRNDSTRGRSAPGPGGAG